MDDVRPPLPSPPVKLMHRLRAQMRAENKAWSTEKAYLSWIKRYLHFHNLTKPEDLGCEHIGSFLSHLANERRVAPSTQSLALNALIYFYRQFLQIDIGTVPFEYAKCKPRMPVVFSKHEAMKVIDNLRGDCRLMALLMYGCGLRVSECLSLRVKDVDLERRQVVVQAGKGSKDRVTEMPDIATEELHDQLRFVEVIFDMDRKRGIAGAALPNAQSIKDGSAADSLAWQFLFPSARTDRDPQDHKRKRHHRHQRYIQKAVKRAIARAGITKNASCHTFRHSYATHLLEDGYDIRTIQTLLGHSDVATTEIYLHVATLDQKHVASPADEFLKLEEPAAVGQSDQRVTG